MRLAADRVVVSVPATAGNLGPGFDALGMALGVRDEVHVHALASAETIITIEGEGADTLARDESHLVVRALREALDHVGASQVGLEIRAIRAIRGSFFPLADQLASSRATSTTRSSGSG